MDDVSLTDVEADSYYPFPSKLFALLYLLFQSPHPLVRHTMIVTITYTLHTHSFSFFQGESNLTFVLHILKQSAPASCPPTLSALKKFVLPDNIPPVKVLFTYL